MIAVRIAPARTPRIGFVNNKSMFVNAGTSLSPETAVDIVSIPNIRVAKPRRIIPVSFFLKLLQNIYKIIPIKASIGVKEVGLKRLTSILSLSIPVILIIHAVTVVPTFAPIITLIACFKVIMPELTKPTTITVVADEL